MKPLGPRLKRLRRRRGLTQMELAQRAKITQGFLSAVETGRKPGVSVTVLVRLARVLKVELGELAQ
jgi:XRE family transcriptional regulator, fatty acid utilization regulator